MNYLAVPHLMDFIIYLSSTKSMFVDLWYLKYLAQEATKVAKYHKGQINGAGISAGAANICVNARARTTPARVCSAPPRSAALGWSLTCTQIL